MGKAPHAKQTRHATEPPHADAASEDADSEPIYLPPLKPRPRLAVALGVVLALWVAFLLGLYFTTVYPERKSTNPRPSAPLPSETSRQ